MLSKGLSKVFSNTTVQNNQFFSAQREELWTEVRDTVQETGIKTIPMEKKCKKAKWLSEEALQITEKKRSKKQRRKGKVCSTRGLSSHEQLERQAEFHSSTQDEA